MNDIQITDRVVAGLSNEAYHAGQGISRSTLWTLWTRTPAHVHLPRKGTKDKELGSAIDDAILDPQGFELRWMRGPSDRRGNKWIEAAAEAANTGRTCLPSGEYDKVLWIRDRIHTNNTVNQLLDHPAALRGMSAFALDEETNLLRKARPDLVRPDLGVIVDLKSTADAGPRPFATSVARYGYHLQEAWYLDVWRDAGGVDTNGFVFLAVEKESALAALYELPPEATARGREIGRQSLDLYAQCLDADSWPGYGDAVQELPLPAWAYDNGQMPTFEDDED